MVFSIVVWLPLSSIQTKIVSQSAKYLLILSMDFIFYSRTFIPLFRKLRQIRISAANHACENLKFLANNDQQQPNFINVFKYSSNFYDNTISVLSMTKKKCVNGNSAINISLPWKSKAKYSRATKKTNNYFKCFINELAAIMSLASLWTKLQTFNNANSRFYYILLK